MTHEHMKKQRRKSAGIVICITKFDALCFVQILEEAKDLFKTDIMGSARGADSHRLHGEPEREAKVVLCI